MAERRTYYDEQPIAESDVVLAFQRNDVDELLHVAIRIGMHAEDLTWAESICLSLAQHDHFNVRGNAILSLGHLARRFSKLTSASSVEAIRRGLSDLDPYVNGQAQSAADDVETFTALKVRYV